MRTVGITGSSGFLGWHTRCLLSVQEKFVVIEKGRELFDSSEALHAFVQECDVIIHLAGANRGTDEEVSRTNPELANSLVKAMEETESTLHIVYSSSTHIDRDTVYGKSKQSATKVFQDWADRQNVRFTNVVLPNLFGENGKPFYNSVVATFCYQLAQGETPSIDHDGEIELLHAQDAASVFLNIVAEGSSGEVRPRGKIVSVSELLHLLESQHASYQHGTIPPLSDTFRLQLFNTYRSYLYPDRFPVQPQLHSDERGSLFEAVQTLHGGQAFLSTTKLDITRGNHFHFSKMERFLVVSGTATIRLRKLFDDTIIEYCVNGDKPEFVDIPTLYTHSITNTGSDELLTLFWSHELFDPSNPDTFAQQVILQGEQKYAEN